MNGREELFGFDEPGVVLRKSVFKSFRVGIFMFSVGHPVHGETTDAKRSATFISLSSLVNQGAEHRNVTVLVFTGAWASRRIVLCCVVETY